MGTIVNYDNCNEPCKCAYFNRNCSSECMALKWNALGDPYCGRLNAEKYKEVLMKKED